MRGSGWVLNKLFNIRLHVVEYQPFQASAFTFVLPKEIRDKKAVVNIQNTCNLCFLYCISAALYSGADETHLERHAKHDRHFKRFNLQGLSFPMQVKDIHKFEKLNNVSISVYGWANKTDNDEGYAYPIKVSKDASKEHIQLLLLEDGDNYHYCSIIFFSRLNGKLCGHLKKVFCRYCLHGFCTANNIK